MGFDQLADKLLAIVVLCLLFDRQVSMAIVLVVGTPMAAFLWLTRRYRGLRGRRQGMPWRVYR